MKDCPSCGAEVPQSAKRCKHCFHDFDEAPKGTNWAGPIALLVSFAAMIVVALLVLFWIVSQPQEQKILVDQGSQSIIWTATYVDGPRTNRLPFSEIARVEYVSHASGGYEIAAVTTSGERKVIQESSTPINGEAKKYAELIGQELTEIDNTRGFGG
jgi:hypothetical protein